MKKAISEVHQKRLDLIASYLRELRFNENLTQKEISTDLNLHLNTIIRLENGHNMTLVSLFELCDYYQIAISQIFND
jgi:transcriptional regulator with XRE-family HTH domain